MSDLEVRLRQERERLGLNRSQFAALAGVTGGSQTNYEAGTRIPDAHYLRAIERIGADVLYVLTGNKASPTHSLTKDEIELLTSYRNLDIRGKVNALGIINSLQNTTEKAQEILKNRGITIHGSVKGEVNHITGSANIKKTIHIGDREKQTPKKKPRSTG